MVCRKARCLGTTSLGNFEHEERRPTAGWSTCHPVRPRGRQTPVPQGTAALLSPRRIIFVKEVTMANKTLFASLKSRFVRADARNEAGGRAYALAPKHALAQLAATGCFNGTLLRHGRGAARHAEDADRPGRRQRLPGQAGGLQPRAGHDEGHAGGAAGGPVEARSGRCSARSSTASWTTAASCARWCSSSARASSAARACRTRSSGRSSGG